MSTRAVVSPVRGVILCLLVVLSWGSAWTWPVSVFPPLVAFYAGFSLFLWVQRFKGAVEAEDNFKSKILFASLGGCVSLSVAILIQLAVRNFSVIGAM